MDGDARTDRYDPFEPRRTNVLHFCGSSVVEECAKANRTTSRSWTENMIGKPAARARLAANPHVTLVYGIYSFHPAGSKLRRLHVAHRWHPSTCCRKRLSSSKLLMLLLLLLMMLYELLLHCHLNLQRLSDQWRQAGIFELLF